MRKHRFFVSQLLQLQQDLTLNLDISHQIINVLRLPIGSNIYLFNNSGGEFTAQIMNITRKQVSLHIVAVSNDVRESPCLINIGQVIGKGEKMDLVIQKATELGAHSITPLFSQHAVIKNVSERSSNKQEHWQKIANAACCQCGRNIVPQINPAQDLLPWIKANNDQVKLILSPNANAPRLKDVPLSSPISILIGPEGGFSASELAVATEHNFLNVSLGPRILRTETTSLAVLAIIQFLIGDI